MLCGGVGGGYQRMLERERYMMEGSPEGIFAGVWRAGAMKEYVLWMLISFSITCSSRCKVTSLVWFHIIHV